MKSDSWEKCLTSTINFLGILGLFAKTFTQRKIKPFKTSAPLTNQLFHREIVLVN